MSAPLEYLTDYLTWHIVCKDIKLKESMFMINKPFKILCIDGGGIKGVFSAQVLAEFEEAFNTKTSEHFDLICGTSTGGIIALGVVGGIPMKDVVQFYVDNGPRIFAQRWKVGKLGEWLFILKQAFVKSKYCDKALRNAMEKVFGQKKIGDSQNLLCIPAFNITNSAPRIFKKDYGHLNQDDNKTFVEVALATTAAPTYFPVQEINSVQYVDGGLYANNPVLVGLTEAVLKGYWIKPKDKRGPEDYDGVQILSISSCKVPTGDYVRCKRRSFVKWISTLFDAYGEGQSKSNDFFINAIKAHLDFEIEIKRVENDPISSIQAKKVSLDKAGKDSLTILKGIGSYVGNNAKNDERIKQLFTEKKTINPLDF